MDGDLNWTNETTGRGIAAGAEDCERVLQGLLARLEVVGTNTDGGLRAVASELTSLAAWLKWRTGQPVAGAIADWVERQRYRSTLGGLTPSKGSNCGGK